MNLTEIEAYVYGGNCAHFVTAFESNDREIRIEFAPMGNNRPDGATIVVATFANSVLLSCDEGADDAWSYPLDPIGFYSYLPEKDGSSS